MDIWTNVWCVWLARSRCMCLAFWFLGPVFMIDNGFRLHTCHGPCHLGLLLLTSKNERDCNVTGALRAIWNDEQRQKKKKRKGIRSLASNLWIVCDSSHDEAFNLEYSNVVAMLGSVQTCSGWPSWIWTIPTTGSCNLLSLAISIYNLFIVTVSLSVFLLVMKTTSDHINTCKEIFLVSQSSQAEVKTVR